MLPYDFLTMARSRFSSVPVEHLIDFSTPSDIGLSNHCMNIHKSNQMRNTMHIYITNTYGFIPFSYDNNNTYNNI